MIVLLSKYDSTPKYVIPGDTLNFKVNFGNKELKFSYIPTETETIDYMACFLFIEGDGTCLDFKPMAIFTQEKNLPDALRKAPHHKKLSKFQTANLVGSLMDLGVVDG